MTPHRVVWPVADRDGVALAQTLGGAGNLNLNGALVVPLEFGSSIKLHSLQPVVLGAKHARMPKGTRRTATLFSAGNLAALSFTFTGLLESGIIDTEALTGPGAGLTVETTKEWVALLSVASNGAVGTAVEVGSGFKGASLWLDLLNSMYPGAPFGVGLFWDHIAAAINTTVQYTPDNVFSLALPDFVAVGSEYAINHPLMAAMIADDDGNISYPTSGVRIKINSSDTLGNGVFTAIASGR